MIHCDDLEQRAAEGQQQHSLHNFPVGKDGNDQLILPDNQLLTDQQAEQNYMNKIILWRIKAV